ncbi:hypothetical protein SEPCBS57363_000702 [Sporothrix epigloea]|uniref:Cytochrome c oxidase assembly protein n=1 Tax=Sporothrix epigloea TaxID=1892477 RepID=A0ABP0D7Q3_9PEZI
MPLPSSTPKVRVRGMILTIGITAITVVGTMAGAGLKSDIETKNKQKMIAEPTGEDDLIAALEARRLGLVQARATWEKKAEVLRERMESSSQGNIGGGSASNGASSGK